MRKKNRYCIIAVGILLLTIALITGCGVSEDPDQYSDGTGLLSSAEDINLHSTDGGETNYAFTYGDEEFSAQYLYDNWTIFDSYKITNEDDMVIICQALIDTHTVHGSDMESFRTAEDMAYEWQQHNLAYEYLPEDNAWRESAANVDFDPEDQGRSFEEIYEDRTGEEFHLTEYIKKKLEDGDLMEELEHFLN